MIEYFYNDPHVVVAVQAVEEVALAAGEGFGDEALFDKVGEESFAIVGLRKEAAVAVEGVDEE